MTCAVCFHTALDPMPFPTYAAYANTTLDEMPQFV
jgi:hypothetical protein